MAVPCKPCIIDSAAVLWRENNVQFLVVPGRLVNVGSSDLAVPCPKRPRTCQGTRPWIVRQEHPGGAVEEGAAALCLWH